MVESYFFETSSSAKQEMRGLKDLNSLQLFAITQNTGHFEGLACIVRKKLSIEELFQHKEKK